MADGEDKITSWFADQSDAPAGMFPIGIGDDMAQINLGGGKSVLITTDMLLDGVHFDLQTATIAQVGYKAMAASLSDCAAMATVPVAAVVSVALPKDFAADGLKELHKGIIRAGDMFGCELIGGDITSWDKSFAVSVTMLSEPGGAGPIRRDGARAGDFLCITGKLGGSLMRKHLEFLPRVNEAFVIAKAGATAMMDISDGLSSDLNDMCKAGGVGSVVDAEKIPLSDEAKGAADPLGSALNDGEDFELLFTIGQKEFEKLSANWDMQTPITKIGVVTEKRRVCIKMPGGGIEDLLPRGYDHLGAER